MRNFKNIIDKTYTFSSCENCEAQCCHGASGSTYAQIILEDFEKVALNFPILFIKGELGFLKPIVLLTNTKDFCPYIKDMKCTIYEMRPSICKLYPLSANIDDNIYIDETCLAINEPGVKIVDKGVVNCEFYHEVLDEYQDKYIKTHLYLDKFNNDRDLEELLKQDSLSFYKLTKVCDDKFINLHQNSLKHLNKEYYSLLK